MELLEKDDLAVDSEDEVFNSVAAWVEYDLINRKADFPDLVRCVRLYLLSSEVSYLHESQASKFLFFNFTTLLLFVIIGPHSSSSNELFRCVDASIIWIRS